MQMTHVREPHQLSTFAPEAAITTVRGETELSGLRTNPLTFGPRSIFARRGESRRRPHSARGGAPNGAW
jgi:hypothetical protein